MNPCEKLTKEVLVPSDWATKSLREEAEPAAELHPQSDLSGNLTKEVLVPSDWITRNLREEARALAFTMAEILLSLTIIGVVAAITLPSLTGNINERTWNTQRKALYARFSQAIALMPALNGYGTLRENTDSAGSTSIEDNAAETFITGGLSKVLKINNICDSDHLADCGIASKFTDLNGNQKIIPADMLTLNSVMINTTISTASGFSSSYSTLNTKAAAFETANGESILTFYNPNCVSNGNENEWHFVQPLICANFVYDLNGNKGPNTVGKDIGFISVLNSSDSIVVAPVPYNHKVGESLTPQEAISACAANNREHRLPNKDEAASLFVNQFFLGLSYDNFVTSSKKDADSYWYQGFQTGMRNFDHYYASGNVLCIYR